MNWRRKVMIACIACLGSWSSLVETAYSQPVSYRLEFKDTGPRAGRPVVITCAEKTRCMGRIELVINDKPRSVLVVVAIGSGYAFVRFFDGPAPLFARGEAYLPIPLGYPQKPRRVMADISEPRPDDLEDGPIRRRPVTRVPAEILATVEIEVRPGD